MANKRILKRKINYVCSELFSEVVAASYSIKADEENVATPANWRPGDDVIIPTAGSCGTAKERVESTDPSQYCLDWFLCFKKSKK